MNSSTEDTVRIVDGKAIAVSPEGIEADMPLADFLQHLAPPVVRTGDLVLPDGVRAVFSREPMIIVVHESPPQVVPVEWITRNSPAPFGPKTTYRRRVLSFPYQVLICVFARDPDGRMILTRRNELFWAVQSLGGAWSGDTSAFDDRDRLRFPTLLNVSRYEQVDMREEGKSLAWLCTQTFAGRDDINRDECEPRRIMRAVNGLARFVRESRYNLSSELSQSAKHSKELRSWFTESAMQKIDPRVETVTAWEKATRKDPAFILEVPFLPVGLSVREVARRIFDIYGPPASATPESADLARIIFNFREGTSNPHGYRHLLF